MSKDSGNPEKPRNNIQLLHPLSDEIKNLLAFAQGYRSKEWFSDSTRFCKNFETNLVGTFLLQKLCETFIAENPVFEHAVKDRIHLLIFVVKNQPLYIWDTPHKHRVPFVVNGKQQYAQTALMNQGVNVPSGVIVEGPYAGLIVEPESQEDINDPSSLNGLTISRLTYLPQNPIAPYKPLLNADDLDFNQFWFRYKGQASIGEKNVAEYLSEEWLKFLQSAHQEILNQYTQMSVQGTEYISVLQNLCRQFNIPFDNQQFNCFI